VRRRTSAVLVALGATLLAGCTSSPTATTGHPSTGVTATRPSTLPGGASATRTEPGGTTTPPGNTVTLGDADKGRTLTVAVGKQVTITLNSTYWRFVDPKPPSVLTPMSAPVVVASPANSPGCVPGQGCGTVSISFRATKPGTTIASATRTTCGEARGCVGDDGSYQITVIVQ
jgi:hypothetical protein